MAFFGKLLGGFGNIIGGAEKIISGGLLGGAGGGAI